MKILVTGGRGFIGSYVCDHLRRSGATPIIFDHYFGLTRPAADDGPSFCGDVRDYTSVSEAIAAVDGVIHLAGVLGTQETILDPEPSVETNIFGAINVFKACLHYDKPCVNIAVGNHWMNNSYSISKTTAERFAAMFVKERGARITTVRAMNAYGPRQKSKPVRKIIPNFIIPAMHDEKITIYGDGSQIMDMIYVEDLAKILVRALLTIFGGIPPAEVIQAGTGRRTTVNYIAERVVEFVKCRKPTPSDFNYVPMRPGEPEKSEVVADTSAMEKHLKIYPDQLVTLENGLRSTIYWYDKHENLDLLS